MMVALAWLSAYTAVSEAPVNLVTHEEPRRDAVVLGSSASSRGELPPKWNGSLFVTTGDQRRWVSQYWVWTTEMLYFPLLAADAVDLTEPFFNMYVRQLQPVESGHRTLPRALQLDQSCRVVR
jgi:hypothetical protein